MTAPFARKTLVRLAALAVVLLVFVALLGDRATRAALPLLIERVRRQGPLGVVVYALAYIPAGLLLLPASPLTVAAGWLFGFRTGLVAGALGSATAATLVLLFGRTVGRGMAASFARRVPRFDALSRALGHHGFEVVMLLRITPLVPFPLLNYALGLTRVRAWQFFAASLVGMLPGNVVYAWLGSQAAHAAELWNRPAALAGPRALLVAAGVILLTIASVTLAGRTLSRTLDRDKSFGDTNRN